MGGAKNGRFLSTESNKIDEPFKVEEAETVNVPPPPSEKVLVRTFGPIYCLFINVGFF